MSEIFLAFQRGPAGFRKIVVLKSILPDIRGEEEFVRMFLHEAKVTAAYEASKDPDSDDYSMSIEEAADKVLADFLDKRKAPAPKNGRPRTETRTETRRPAKVWTDDDEDGQRTPTRDVEEPAPAMLDYAARTRYALDRAAKRAAR